MGQKYLFLTLFIATLIFIAGCQKTQEMKAQLTRLKQLQQTIQVPEPQKQSQQKLQKITSSEEKETSNEEFFTPLPKTTTEEKKDEQKKKDRDSYTQSLTTNSRESCSEITDYDLRAICEHNIIWNDAVKNNDPSKCEALPSPKLIEQCKEEIS